MLIVKPDPKRLAGNQSGSQDHSRGRQKVSATRERAANIWREDHEGFDLRLVSAQAMALSSAALAVPGGARTVPAAPEPQQGTPDVRAVSGPSESLMIHTGTVFQLGLRAGSRRPGWMPRVLSQNLRQRVVAAIDAGMSCWAAAARFDVSPASASAGVS